MTATHAPFRIATKPLLIQKEGLPLATNARSFLDAIDELAQGSVPKAMFRLTLSFRHSMDSLILLHGKPLPQTIHALCCKSTSA
jgi:hypothetical protein